MTGAILQFLIHLQWNTINITYICEENKEEVTTSDIFPVVKTSYRPVNHLHMHEGKRQTTQISRHLAVTG